MKDSYIYPAIVSFDSDGISIEFPDLPGCLPSATNEEEIFRVAKEALELHLYGMEEDNEEIPEASKLPNISLEENQIVLLVEAWMIPLRDKMATKSINKMVTIPKWLIEAADRKNVNYSQVLQQSLKDYLGVYDYMQARKDKKKV